MPEYSLFITIVFLHLNATLGQDGLVVFLGFFFISFIKVNQVCQLGRLLLVTLSGGWLNSVPKHFDRPDAVMKYHKYSEKMSL